MPRDIEWRKDGNVLVSRHEPAVDLFIRPRGQFICTRIGQDELCRSLILFRIIIQFTDFSYKKSLNIFYRTISSEQGNHCDNTASDGPCVKHIPILILAKHFLGSILQSGPLTLCITTIWDDFPLCFPRES